MGVIRLMSLFGDYGYNLQKEELEKAMSSNSIVSVTMGHKREIKELKKQIKILREDKIKLIKEVEELKEDYNRFDILDF